MTINLNGLCTKIQKGTTLGQYAQGESLDFFGIQKPHLYTQEDVSIVASLLTQDFTNLNASPHTQGGGGGARNSSQMEGAMQELHSPLPSGNVGMCRRSSNAHCP